MYLGPQVPAIGKFSCVQTMSCMFPFMLHTVHIQTGLQQDLPEEIFPHPLTVLTKQLWPTVFIASFLHEDSTIIKKGAIRRYMRPTPHLRLDLRAVGRARPLLLQSERFEKVLENHPETLDKISKRRLYQSVLQVPLSFNAASNIF